MVIISPFPALYTYREKFIVEQEIREKEEAIRHQNSEVHVSRKLVFHLLQNSLA